MIMQLARQLSVCGLTDLDLITGRFCEKVIDALTDDLVDGDGYIVQVKQGAMVAVWWRFCFDKEAMDYQETVDSIMIGLRSSRHVFRSVLSNPLVLLSSVEKTWKRVEMGVDLLSTFLEWGIEHSDGPFQIHSDILEPDDFIELYKVLEVLQNVILFCPQSATRQNAYKVLVNMIRNVLPPEEKFKALKQLITQSEQSSMISLLMYVVKEEVDNAISLRRDPSKQHLNSPFASEKVMELINFVLRPTTGPPELPQQIDAVLSALNLYRFLLIKEEAGRSNYTGVLLKSSLEEACSKWFHPLRTFLEGFKRSFCASDADVTASVLLSVSCVEGVLYRCLELAEAALKNHYT
ncbi:hypothetical protein KP509_15G024800 [Ceratopteris richardii]|nr:hypothetical protein KP509_15G024800 [Ceratopteris richardii]